ncbi:MAG: hypothetical protein AAFX06_16490 [Planctomycetota bacterium]
MVRPFDESPKSLLGTHVMVDPNVNQLRSGERVAEASTGTTNATGLCTIASSDGIPPSEDLP